MVVHINSAVTRVMCVRACACEGESEEKREQTSFKESKEKGQGEMFRRPSLHLSLHPSFAI